MLLLVEVALDVKVLLRSESRVVPVCVFIVIDVPESSCIFGCEWFIFLKIKRLSKDLWLFRIDTISQLDGRESFREKRVKYFILQMCCRDQTVGPDPDTVQLQDRYCLSFSNKCNKRAVHRAPKDNVHVLTLFLAARISIYCLFWL